MTIEDIKAILLFSKKVKPSTFDDIFGKKLGKHLWDKYTIDYKRDFMEFFNSELDAKNKALIAAKI